jgi:GNAT superfamily N-acetyltransferase
MEIIIDLLKNHQECINTLIKIGREALGSTWAPDEVQLRLRLNSDILPLAFVALDTEKPVGLCVLSQNKPIRPDLSPWLGPVFVDKKYQKCGIGTKLIEAIKQKALTLGFEKLYLCTHDSDLANKYYKKRGWNIIGIDKWKGHSVTVMEISL